MMSVSKCTLLNIIQKYKLKRETKRYKLKLTNEALLTKTIQADFFLTFMETHHGLWETFEKKKHCRRGQDSEIHDMYYDT